MGLKTGAKRNQSGSNLEDQEARLLYCTIIYGVFSYGWTRSRLYAQLDGRKGPNWQRK